VNKASREQISSEKNCSANITLEDPVFLVCPTIADMDELHVIDENLNSSDVNEDNKLVNTINVSYSKFVKEPVGDSIISL
jgi:hypothetical protein